MGNSICTNIFVTKEKFKNYFEAKGCDVSFKRNDKTTLHQNSVPSTK